MGYDNPVHLSPAIITVILTCMLALASTSPPPAAAGGCTDEVVAFSPCLPYISSPPNAVTFSPSSQCCDVFSWAFDDGNGDCLCYLVRRPLLLGFPLNSTRLFSLSSLCPLRNAGSKANGSLESLCSGSSTLPPLQGIIGPGISSSGNLTGSDHFRPDNSAPPLMSSLPDPVDSPPATPSSSTTIPTSSSLMPYIFSSATKQINNCGDWFPLGMVIFLAPIFTNLHTHH